MSTVDSDRTIQPTQSSRSSWEEPAVAFERTLLAEAQDGIGPRGGAPSGLLGPLASSGSTTTATCV